MLLGVAAAVYAFERREIIRQTWGTYAETENVKVTNKSNYMYRVGYLHIFGLIARIERGLLEMVEDNILARLC